MDFSLKHGFYPNSANFCPPHQIVSLKTCLRGKMKVANSSTSINTRETRNHLQDHRELGRCLKVDEHIGFLRLVLLSLIGTAFLEIHPGVFLALYGNVGP